jgi:hypothetical protein
MRNKWYVGGIVAAALLLTWGAVHAALGGRGLLLASVPAALAAALIVAAVKVAKADSFAPHRAERWDLDDKASVHNWLQERADGHAKSDPKSAARR